MEGNPFHLILRVDSCCDIRYRPWRLGEEDIGPAELNEIEMSRIREGRPKYDTRVCGTESLDFISGVRALGNDHRQGDFCMSRCSFSG